MNYDSVVIDPPRHFRSYDRDRLDTVVDKIDHKKTKPLRRFRVLVDSSNRNTTTFPNVYDYAVDLFEPIYGVERIELVRAFFPTTLYLLNDTNNTFAINVGSGTVDVPLNNGNYTPSELAVELTTQLDAAATTGTGWEAEILPSTGQIQIISSNVTTPAIASFTVEGTQMPNLAPILGFGVADYASTAQIVTSPYTVNTSFPNNVILQIGDGTQQFDSLSVPILNNHLKCFSYIPLGSGNGGTSTIQTSAATVSGASIMVAGSGATGGYGYFYIPKDATNSYYDFYDGPKDQIRRLNIRLQQIVAGGTLINPSFNNANHIIEFEILARVDKTSLI